MRLAKALFFLCLWFFTAGAVFGLELVKPQGYVSDYAGLFSSQFKASLEENLSQFKQKTGVEIAVVAIASLEGESIDEYAVRLFEDWKIGEKEKDNGLLLLVSKQDRQIRIEVGYGLEPVINDARAGRIIREQIVPNFKQENYEQGVKEAVEKLQAFILSGETGEEQAVEEQSSDVVDLIIFGSIIMVYLASFLGRSKRFWPGGVLGAIIGLFLGAVANFFFLIFILAGLGFFLDYIFSKNYQKLKKAGRSTGFWSSRGGFGSGRFGSGGFGGFGGGRSGGGGASGGW